jgi:hypothetical protein
MPCFSSGAIFTMYGNIEAATAEAQIPITAILITKLLKLPTIAAAKTPVARGMILSVDLRFNDFSTGLF